MEEPSVKKKENPLVITHIKLLRLFLYSVATWPSETLEGTFPVHLRFLRKYLPTQALAAILGQVHFLVENFKEIDFFLIGHMYITLFLSLLTEVRLLIPNLKQYGIICQRFFFEFHLIHLKHKGDYYKKMYNIIHKVSHYYTVYTLVTTMAALIFFNLVTLHKNWQSGAYRSDNFGNSTLEHAVYLSFPKYNPDQYPVWSAIVNFYLSYCCSVLICFTDLLLYLVGFQIIGHILILDNSIKHVATPKIQIVDDKINNDVIGVNFFMFDDEENITIHYRIVDIVYHHRDIISFTDDFSELFGPILALNYLYQLFSCCLLLLECSTGRPDVLIRYGIITVIIFGQLIQTSIIFEVVGTVSEKLKDSVYAIPWEHMNIKNQRTVCILLNRIQKPITVTAMGMTTVGVQTMAGILKTTFSYFAFLRSMQ